MIKSTFGNFIAVRRRERRKKLWSAFKRWLRK